MVSLVSLRRITRMLPAWGIARAVERSGQKLPRAASALRTRVRKTNDHLVHPYAPHLTFLFENSKICAWLQESDKRPAVSHTLGKSKLLKNKKRR